MTITQAAVTLALAGLIYVTALALVCAVIYGLWLIRDWREQRRWARQWSQGAPPMVQSEYESHAPAYDNPRRDDDEEAAA